MLNDRQYMNNKKPSINDLDPIKCVYWLIAANVVMFMFIAPPVKSGSGFNSFALYSTTNDISTIYRMVTAIFLHGSFGHLFFNMFAIYMFGRFIAPRLGSKRFLQLFLISGVAGNLLWFFANMNSPYPLVGASGGVFGILVATALLVPNMKVLLLIPPIPLKMKTLVIVFGLLEIFYSLTGVQDNVANLAHLGGLVGGYITIRYVFKMQVWDVFNYIFGKPAPRKSKPFKAPNGWTMNKKPEAKPQTVKMSSASDSDVFTKTNIDVPQKEMDRILDKISDTGIKTLTKEELEMLKSARSKMKGNK